MSKDSWWRQSEKLRIKRVAHRSHFRYLQNYMEAADLLILPMGSSGGPDVDSERI
jgi:hypothetical protein